MTQTMRTATFVGVALVLGVLAYVTQPKPVAAIPSGLVGKVLFEQFEDPSDAASVKILRYDDELGKLHEFEVARNSSGLWSIPSHANYPADGEKQMKQAALCLVGLKVLGLVDLDPAKHELYGVQEPKRDGLKLGSKGVGLLVSFRDAKGKSLAGLIVGKKVKGNEEQRFVRVPGQDPIYAVEFDPTQLSTKFEDWIEPDLLKLSTIDVQEVALKDHSFVLTQGGRLIPEKRFDAVVRFNSTDSQWELEQLINYRRQEGSLTQFDAFPTSLLESEELNATNLNELKSALGDMKIVDVRRKPPGLSADLTAGEEFMSENEARQSLYQLGFYPIDGAGQGGSPELLSANGEVHVLMKEGYEYVLRFGNVTQGDNSASDGQLNRYLFVTTRVDNSRFPKPVLEDLPPAPHQDTTGCQDEGQPPAASDQEEAQRKLAAERERIKKENQRKLDEWNDRKQQAEEKVRELNGRFADWYYVISEDVYKKIHLSRSDLIRETAQAQEAGFGVDAFRELQKQGLPELPTANQ